MDNVVKLPEVLDVVRTRAVFEDLMCRRGSPVIIDASDVEKASALAIEVLISGRLQWAADGQSFDMTRISDAFSEAWSELGVTPTGTGATASPDAVSGGTQ